MKKFLIGCLAVIVFLVLALVVVGFLLPTEYEIEERVTIQADAAKIHALVGDLQRWPEWSPWEEMDPSIVTTLGEKTTGVGASQTWTADSGDGELTFTACDPATGVEYDMAFIMGDTRAPATGALKYAPAGDGTEVVWTMQGDVSDYMPPVIGGYMNVFMKLSISAMYQEGLTKLKAKAEG
jgi:hypothetical protein